MFTGLEHEYDEFTRIFDSTSRHYFAEGQRQNHHLRLAWDSMGYTYFQGGKRFRPFLCFLVSKVYGTDFQSIVPFAVAVECIHTYSLIHDDLPSLDNDDLRRGRPTNHKVYGDDIALLAGDGLLTEAFKIISGMQNISPDRLLAAISLLAEKAGATGMVGGQVLDIKVDAAITVSRLEEIHLLKTAGLIQAAGAGTAILAGADAAELQNWLEVFRDLGIAFQIKDDLLDGLDSDQNFKNYLRILGNDETRFVLQTKTNSAKDRLRQIGRETEIIERLIDFNQNRTQ